jgi:hypothetical protein
LIVSVLHSILSFIIFGSNSFQFLPSFFSSTTTNYFFFAIFSPCFCMKDSIRLLTLLLNFSLRNFKFVAYCHNSDEASELKCRHNLEGREPSAGHILLNGWGYQPRSPCCRPAQKGGRGTVCAQCPGQRPLTAGYCAQPAPAPGPDSPCTVCAAGHRVRRRRHFFCFF